MKPLNNEEKLEILKEKLKVPLSSFSDEGFDIKLYYNKKSIGTIGNTIFSDSFKEWHLQTHKLGWNEIYLDNKEEIDQLVFNKYGENCRIACSTFRLLYLTLENEQTQNIEIEFIDKWQLV